MKKKFSLLLAALFVLLMIPNAALAEDENDVSLAADGAGNTFFEGGLVGQSVALDAYGTGEAVAVFNSQIGESLLLAGRDLTMDATTIGGSLRAAGYSLKLGQVVTAANATLAAYRIDMAQNFSAKGVYAAASQINFDGVCDTLSLAASDVTLGGTVNGNARIYAKTVMIADDANITGTLFVSSVNEPVIPATAHIGSLKFDKIEEEAAVAVTTAARVMSVVRKLLRQVPGAALLAVIFFFAIGKSVKGSGEMLVKKPAPMLLTGLVALVAVPFAAILLFISYIGVSAGFLLLGLYALALVFAVSFCGSSVGMKLLPKLPGVVSCIIGAAAFALAQLIPFVGGLLGFGCMLFTLGYFLQVIYENLQKKPAPNAPNAPDVPETPAVGSVAADPQDKAE